MRREGVVAFADTDASGWIHFTAPLRWVEETEHALVRSVGLDPSRFPRGQVNVSYRAPLQAGDSYEVDLRIAKVGRTSISYAWTVTKAGQECVTGEHTAIHLGAQGRPEAIPDALRAAATDAAHATATA